uniref:Predicted protein n=1 Tax=Hordeum vulgare subsp. vulgare TaxID=112509 RepID=F2CZ83_HORVV|nr:predicted protein [Hordeum vulgare subsp. vulgare]BAK01730.1 predicted protein [Hordeum vulgare subsp. vulgare]
MQETAVAHNTSTFGDGMEQKPTATSRPLPVRAHDPSAS